MGARRGPPGRRGERAGDPAGQRQPLSLQGLRRRLDAGERLPESSSGTVEELLHFLHKGPGDIVMARQSERIGRWWRR
ncbi:MAG: hypothetical protein M5U09_08630 [Gammaproteobacteria bacterium]|nr:hypothetical protein [Gammaproteobacteria bacterium]